MTKQYLDELTYKVIGTAIEVHKTLGPGLLESVYQNCLEHELNLHNIHFLSQPVVPVYYKDIEIDAFLRCDFFIENCLVVEVKSVETMKPIFASQLLTYMKLLEAPKGILINFNCVNLFKEGQKTYVNDIFGSLPDS
jgi:GxxExxY protein